MGKVSAVSDKQTEVPGAERTNQALEKTAKNLEKARAASRDTKEALAAAKAKHIAMMKMEGTEEYVFEFTVDDQKKRVTHTLKQGNERLYYKIEDVDEANG